jgi:DnaJ-class molecular chaperone
MNTKHDPAPVDLASESAAGEEDPGASIDFGTADAAGVAARTAAGAEQPAAGDGRCPACGGSGKVAGITCRQCEGTGKATVSGDA